MKYSAVILAGGKSSRMKMNKALLPLGERTFIGTIVEELKSAFDEIIVVTNTPQEYSFLDCSFTKDLFHERGPLGGIHAGLTCAGNKYAFITACDMPFVNGRAAFRLARMASGFDGAVPKKGQHLQPLFAVYSQDCIPAIEKCLEENKNKITAFYPYVKLLFPYWDNLVEKGQADKTFFNVNSPDDLELFKKHHKE